MTNHKETPLKLYAVYLGGSAPRANIELHDVVFTVGTSLKETFPELKKKWFAYPHKIPHIDSWIELTHVNGYEIQFTTDKERDLSLYFVNFGGYSKNLFGEHHQSAFYVAHNKTAATKKARTELCKGMVQPHLDNHLEIEKLIQTDDLDVDDIIEIDHVDGHYLKFVPSDIKTTSPAHPGYLKIE